MPRRAPGGKGGRHPQPPPNPRSYLHPIIPFLFCQELCGKPSGHFGSTRCWMVVVGGREGGSASPPHPAPESPGSRAQQPGLARLQHPPQLHCSADVASPPFASLAACPHGRSGPTGKEPAASHPLASSCPHPALSLGVPGGIWGWMVLGVLVPVLFVEWVFCVGGVCYTHTTPPEFPAHHVSSGMVLGSVLGR